MLATLFFRMVMLILTNFHIKATGYSLGHVLHSKRNNSRMLAGSEYHYSNGWYLVTFPWLKLIRNHKLTQNLGFSIPFTSKFMIMTSNKHSVRISVGWTCMYPCYCQTATFHGIWWPFFGSNWYETTNWLWLIILVLAFLSTSKVHDHDFEQAFRTHISGVNMYVPPLLLNGYISLYLVTFLWLKLIWNHKLTQNLGFSIPFHL